MPSTRALVLACLATFACKGAPVVVEQPEVEEAKSACDDTKMAIVGGEAIQMADFELFYSLVRRKYERKQLTIGEAGELAYQKDISERLIYYKLLELECRRLGIDYDEAKLATRMAETRALGDTLEEQHGESLDTARMGKIAALRERVLLEHGGRLEVTADEVAALYESERDTTFDDQARIRVGRVVIKTEGPVNEADVLALAEEIFKRANAGEDFDRLSDEYQGRRQKTEQGGEIRIYVYEDIEEEQPGIISELVRTESSYLVILVLDRYPPGELPLAAIEESLVSDLEGLHFLHAQDVLFNDLSKYEVENCMAARATSRGLAW
jgi:hypothetical protein